MPPAAAGGSASRSTRTAGRITRWFATRPALYYALTGVVAFPILELILRGQLAIQYAHDVLDGELPALASIGADWSRYGISLWNPHLTSGNAVLAQLALPPFTPDLLLAFAIPLFAAYALTYVAIIWVAGYGMHRFVRDSLRLGGPAAFVGGTIYALSFWHYVHGFAMPLLPLTLWLTDRWARGGEGRWREALALVVLGGFRLYTGLLQVEVIVVATQGAYLLATLRGSGRLARRVGEWLVLVAASLMLFAPVLVSQLVALPGSHRAIWVLPELSPGESVRQAISHFSAALVGVPVEGLTTGHAEYAGTYFLGGIGLPLLVIGILAGRRTGASRFLLAAIVGVPLLYLAALLAMPWLGEIPVVSSFQFVRVSHLLPWVLAANVAIGVHVVWSGGWPALARRRLTRVVLGAAFALLLVQAVYAALRPLVIAPGAGDRTLAGWLLAAAAIGTGMIVGGAMLGVALRRPTLAGALPGAPTAMGALVLVALLGGLLTERALFARSERYLHGGLGTWAATMVPDEALRYVADQPGSGLYRTLTAGRDANPTAIPGLMEAGGYQSIYPLVYHRLFGALTDPYLSTDDDMWRYFHEWGNRAYVFGPGLNGSLLDLMGIRWVYAHAMPLHEPGLELVFEEGETQVYENRDVLPRAFVVHAVRPFDTDDELLGALSTADPGELRTTAFVLAADLAPAPPLGAPAAEDAVDVVRYEPDEVELRVASASPGMVVLTDTHAPGWMATVNGTETPIVRVDEAYRAVAVPAGESTVAFAYRPWFTYAGAWLAGIASLVIAGWAAASLVRDRRRRPAGGPPPGIAGPAGR